MDLYVGVLSGTSMDAVDAVLAEVGARGVQVRDRHAQPIPPSLGGRLQRALDTEKLSALECWRLDAEVGALFAQAVQALLARAGVAPEAVRAVGSHGQTLYHAPDAQPPLTVQVGDPCVIAWRTGITTVADFRRMDVAAGGQGAPLAPAFHAFAFADASRPRAVLNLGGIANLTLLAPAAPAPVLGFDTGPGNTLMDVWCAANLSRAFDTDGAWAASGSVQPALLAALREDPYFALEPPKSTGRERFNAAWLQRALHDHDALAPADVQRTLCELTAVTVTDALRRHAADTDELYVCGGGALNPTLMEALGAALPGWRVDTTAALGVPPKAVEGAAFAWLAHERLAGRAAGLPAVTGAGRATVLGGIYRA